MFLTGEYIETDLLHVQIPVFGAICHLKKWVILYMYIFFVAVLNWCERATNCLLNELFSFRWWNIQTSARYEAVQIKYKESDWFEAR